VRELVNVVTDHVDARYKHEVFCLFKLTAPLLCYCQEEGDKES